MPKTSSCSDDRISSNTQDHLVLLQIIEDNLTRKFKAIHGTDNEETEYESITEFWYSILKIKKGYNNHHNSNSTINHEHSLSHNRVVLEWYQKARHYWNSEDNAPATIDGMLGGYSEISDRDIRFSTSFIDQILVEKRPILKERLITRTLSSSHRSTMTRSCECGAGIGRVTKGLLLPLGFEHCDLVESSSRLLSEAPHYIGQCQSNQCTFIHCGLEDFYPHEDYYDLVWIQWVIGYLTDNDCVQFLQRMGQSLRKEPKGMIIIKDNTCTGQAFVVDKNDSSLTRSLDYLLTIIELSGLRVVRIQEVQEDFPKDIFQFES